MLRHNNIQIGLVDPSQGFSQADGPFLSLFFSLKMWPQVAGTPPEGIQGFSPILMWFIPMFKWE